MREIKFRCWNGSAKVMQCWQEYTGLKDRNGVEIYEGDILRQSYKDSSIRSGLGCVELGSYSDGEYVSDVQCWTACDSPVSDNGGLWGEAAHYWEVVGNINENPELLAR